MLIIVNIEEYDNPDDTWDKNCIADEKNSADDWFVVLWSVELNSIWFFSFITSAEHYVDIMNHVFVFTICNKLFESYDQ